MYIKSTNWYRGGGKITKSDINGLRKVYECHCFIACESNAFCKSEIRKGKSPGVGVYKKYKLC